MPKPRRYATVEETLQALNSLTHQDNLQLIKDATRFIKGSDYSDPHELINEACVRCIEQDRRWFFGVTIKTFLYFSMKSLASKDHLSKSYVNEFSLEQFEETYGIEAIGILGGVTLSAEETYIQKLRTQQLSAILGRIKKHFQDDPDATIVIEHWLDDKKIAEIVRESGISIKRYDAARNRISRYLKGKKDFYQNQLS